MLILNRRINEKFTVGEATLTVVEIRGGIVRIGITAPKSIPIVRDDAIERLPKVDVTRPRYQSKD